MIERDKDARERAVVVRSQLTREQLTELHAAVRRMTGPDMIGVAYICLLEVLTMTDDGKNVLSEDPEKQEMMDDLHLTARRYCELFEKVGFA
jgi:hypothetical protein